MYYYKEKKETVLNQLRTGANGLTKEEVAKRLQKYGMNEIEEEKKKSVAQVFFLQFADLLVVILIVSAIISAATGNVESAIVILCVITLNAILGTVQHFKAEKSLDSLNKMSAPMARVVRDGIACEIPAREICPGDILMVEAGNIAAADGRIIEAASLMVNESSLTGESDSIEKTDKKIEAVPDKEIMLGDRINMIYSGSQITAGRGVVVVTETGMNTEIGKIATLINTAQRKKTPLQRKLDDFSKSLAIIIIIISVIVMGLSMLRGEKIIDALMFAVALAVAAIPEALSSIVMISLALGTQKMARENAIIKDLKAVEGLGCVSIICSDKTGTLTQNKMTVREIYYENKYENIEKSEYKNIENNRLFISMILCNDAIYTEDNVIGDPTETALLECCDGEWCKKVRKQYPRLSEIPFDSNRKIMSTAHNIDGKLIMITKGATDVLVDKLDYIYEKGSVCKITSNDIKKIKAANKLFSEKGMRVLCFVEKCIDECGNIGIQDEYGYTFIGLAAMTDPPRAESIAAVADCKRAGIKPIMITGDHKITATAIAREIGIFEDEDIALDGAELECISDNELIKLLPRVSVYARVSPEHKIRIVTLWQELGHIVAMTGDGVNDAPALKKADAGIAMGITGTQVSKDAASIILADDNFATIVKAVSNGRAIYQNIKNSIKFLLSGNIAGIISVLYTVVLGLPMPFTAVHLLFINLLTDSLPAIAISMEPADRDIMKNMPRKPDESMLDKKIMTSVFLQAILFATGTITAYYIGIQTGIETARTMAFSTLCLARLFGCFNCRGEKPLIKLKFKSNPFCILAFLAGIAFLCSALFITPLHGLFDITILDINKLFSIFCLALAPNLIIQIWKLIKYYIY
ncbi:MAG: cation-translocating P-type ATPase [Eubacterium sp.]